jgi:hypothetical protein
MKRTGSRIVFVATVMFLGACATLGFGQSAPAAGAAGGDVVKAEAQDELAAIGKRVLMFATQMPAEKYTWNPGLMLQPPAPDPQADPYGRTVADLFLHIANVNFTRPVVLGAAPPEGFDPKNYETSTTDKAKVIEQVTKSFAYAQGALAKLSDADVAKTFMVNKKATPGDVVLFGYITEIDEYLGQAIAYGRLNGVIGTGQNFALRKPGQ